MSHPLGLAPSKIIAVHLNYRSRAAQRGRVPTEPSYFLKPPSSLSWSGQPLVRPQEGRLLGVEGEIAVVIGRQARHVPVRDAHTYVRGYLPANDVGLYDLRAVDRGSNLRSKGSDGYTPVGSELLPAAEADPSGLRLRTWVNSQLVQDATSDDLLFSFAELIADLSRLITLEAGDLILAGTPAGAPIVSPGDVVEVQLGDGAVLSNEVTRADAPLAALGAMPTVGPSELQAADVRTAGATGGPALSSRTTQLLKSVSTATLSSQLRARGLQHTFIEGVSPTRPDLRMVGVARTLRYVALREDVFERIGGGMNAQKQMIESLGDRDVLVIEARGDLGAGTLGDILALRAAKRGAAGVVTDGCLRDSPSFADLDLPAYSAGAHAAVLGRRHVPYECDVAVSCGGVLVLPGDICVGDAEGVIVIPAALVDEVAKDAAEQERREQFIYARVAEGESIDGLYPMNAQWKQRYERAVATGSTD